jgi:cytochrome c oxidase cbb3-type subunit 1
MNATCSTTQSTSPGGGSIPTSEIDASCRAPLLVLFGHAAFWLIVASVFGLIASLKFHAPNLLSVCAWFTYGRVHAVATTAFLYGFAIQAGLGVGLWIIARLGQTKVAQPWFIAIGGKLWNLGVLLGVIGILAGNSTGFENLEMPRYSAVPLFIGYLLIGIWSVLTLHQRRERSLQPSEWFLLAALFWFPWIFSTARLMLVWCPVRGVTQAVIAWWFSANLNSVWLALVGLAAIFHFIPKLTNKPLHSQHLALFTFWTLILFASWSGIPASAPLPAWMPALSAVATVLTAVTVLSVMVNVYKTVGRGCSQQENPPPGKFIAFGLMAFVVAGLMNVAGAIPQISAVTNFTWFTVAQSQLNSYGFFAMTMFGAIYLIVPQVTGIEWPSAKFVRAHFWLAAIGIILVVVPLAIGGVVQGMKLNHPQIAFVDLTKATLPFLRASTTGELLIAFGHLLFALNLTRLVVCFARTHLAPAYAAATVELKPAEVKP